jgi:flagellar biosynthesis protein FlhG
MASAERILASNNTSDTGARSLSTLALVSGRGGSGKTLIATAMAQALALSGNNVLLVDADMGTGGLSYYLGFNAFGRIKEGLSEFLAAETSDEDRFKLYRENIVWARKETIVRLPVVKQIQLLPVGEHRTLDSSERKIPIDKLADLIFTIRNDNDNMFNYVVFDCRGGIDDDSIAVSSLVEDIVIVVETDAAAIQATQYLVNVLIAKRLHSKIKGFVLNKVMDNPVHLASTASRFFRTEYLGAVPFDLETTREFIRGNVPKPSSIFCRHVFRAAGKLYRLHSNVTEVPILSDTEFSTVTLKDPDVSRGNMFVLTVVLLIMLGYGYTKVIARYSLVHEQYEYLLITLGLFSLCALSDTVKKQIGRVLHSYARLFRMLLHQRD